MRQITVKLQNSCYKEKMLKSLSDEKNNKHVHIQQTEN